MAAGKGHEEKHECADEFAAEVQDFNAYLAWRSAAERSGGSRAGGAVVVFTRVAGRVAHFGGCVGGIGRKPGGDGCVGRNVV